MDDSLGTEVGNAPSDSRIQSVLLLESEEARTLCKSVYKGIGLDDIISPFSDKILNEGVVSNFADVPLDEITRFVFLRLKGYSPRQISEILSTDVSTIESCLEGITFLDPTEDYSLSQVTGSLVEYLSRSHLKEDVKVMMGTTPSGELHLANMYTILNGTVRVNEACSELGKTPSFVLGFNDTFVPAEDVHYIPDRLNIIKEFVGALEDKYGVSIEIMEHSELQKRKDFRDLLSYVASKNLFKNDRKRGLTLKVSPAGEYKFENVSSDIANNETDFYNTNVDFSSDFRGMISLRANYVHPDVHILGDDLVHDYRIYSRTRFLRPNNRPFRYRTGILFGQDGNEMHVSKGNIISFTDLKNIPKLLDRVYELGNAPVKLIGPIEYSRLIH